MAEKQNTPSRRPACHLVKQNLPGLMGRRDAAWDHAVRLTLFTGSDLCPPAEQMQVCQNVLELLGIAHVDTDAILKLLSSPDTESRERKLYSLQEITLSMADAWGKLTALEQDLFGADTILANFDAAGDEEEKRANTQNLHGTREILLKQLRNTLDSVRPRLERYRSYSANSFSAAYAERYKNAYSNYQKLYSEKFPL